jgi:hypothetical protein
MPLLEAFLALALTMLSLAVIASLLVEFVHRLARTRANDLKGMLEGFYDRELRSFVETELKKTGKALDDHKKAFIERLAANPLLFGSTSQPQGRIMSSLKPLESLSTQDFHKRLAYTDIGKVMKEKTEIEIDELVDSLSRAYDAFGVAATDLFKRRAELISLAAGLLVAFGLNVNALRVFEQYLDDPQLRANVVAQADLISAKYRESIDKSDVKGFKNGEEAEEFVKSFKEDVASLEKSGVTIGYSPAAPPCSLWDKHERPWPQSLLFTVLWLLGVVGTGLLIGLGGPFWFDIVRKLTEVIQVARGGAATDRAETGKPTGAAPDPMKSLKDTFKKIGGLPPLVKAQSILSAATEATTDTDNAV